MKWTLIAKGKFSLAEAALNQTKRILKQIFFVSGLSARLQRSPKPYKGAQDKFC
jgi:hypothetical protein